MDGWLVTPHSQAGQAKYETVNSIKYLPLNTFLPNRCTTECLLRVAHHCKLVRDNCQCHRQDQIETGMFGGLQVSLNMNKAFDSVNRTTVGFAIELLPLPQDLRTMMHTLLHPHKYYISHK